MATANLPIPRGWAYTLVSEGAIITQVTPRGADGTEFASGTALPPTTLAGHVRDRDKEFPAQLAAGENLYARNTNRSVTLVIDETAVA